MSLERAFGDGASVLDDTTFRLLVLANINGAIGAVVVSPVLEGLAGPYGIDGASLGLMMSAFTAPSIVGIPLAGAIADRYGRKPVLIASLLLFGAGGSALAFTTNYTVVLALRGVQGVGYSGIIPVVITSIGDVYADAEETAAHGLRFSSSALSQAVFPAFAGALAALSWRFPFLLFAVAFPIAGLVYVGLEEPSSTPRSDGGRPATRDTGAYVRAVLSAVARPRLGAVLLALGVPAFVWITFLTYNSFFVVEVLGHSPLYASALLTVLSLVNATTASQAGRVTAATDGAFRPLVAANVALAVGLGLFALAPSIPVAVLAVGCVGVGFGLSFSLLRNVVTDRVDAELRGGVVGIGESIIRLSNSVGPLVTGAAIALLSPGRGFVASLRWTVLVVAVATGVGGVAVIYVAWRD
ncbi:MFS transporter [Haloplanus aerogenes]|uniref:Putative MFS family arabinose efflux permease n=1 Tax=Haloplanus aerogenes TaxID=660522 RepID=A0A3M0DYY7_9EURY|nr:MFS transporter [Haloplanus aerogenes]RMB25186.1 putative MFS family arabinose efflux permease [Haloplanus aerogenes]